MRTISLQFSSISPLTDWVVGGGGWGGENMRDDSAEILFSSFLQERRPLWADLAWAGMSPLWCYPSSISSADHASPSLQNALKDGFGEAVVACDMPKPECARFFFLFFFLFFWKVVMQTRLKSCQHDFFLLRCYRNTSGGQYQQTLSPMTAIVTLKLDVCTDRTTMLMSNTELPFI